MKNRKEIYLLQSKPSKQASKKIVGMQWAQWARVLADYDTLLHQCAQGSA